MLVKNNDSTSAANTQTGSRTVHSQSYHDDSEDDMKLPSHIVAKKHASILPSKDNIGNASQSDATAVNVELYRRSQKHVAAAKQSKIPRFRTTASQKVLPQPLEHISETEEEIEKRFLRAKQQSEVLRRKMRENAELREAELETAEELERQEDFLVAEERERDLQIKRMEHLAHMHQLREKREEMVAAWGPPPNCAKEGLKKWRIEKERKHLETLRQQQAWEETRIRQLEEKEQSNVKKEAVSSNISVIRPQVIRTSLQEPQQAETCSSALEDSIREIAEPASEQ